MVQEQITDINGKPVNRWALLLTLVLGAFTVILSSTMLATANTAIMKAFDISTSDVQWLTTAFLMTNGIVIPVSAYLINKFKNLWVFEFAMIMFLIGSTLAYTAPSFGVLLVARIVQAIGVGIIMPLMQNITLSIFPTEGRGAAMGLMGVAIGVAPAIGPTLAGWIIDSWTWRDLFAVLIPFSLLAVVLGFIFIKNVMKPTNPKLDVFSMITSILGFGSLLYGISTAGSDGWTDGKVLATIGIGVIIIAIFVWRQLHIDEPFLDLRVFATKEYTISSILGSISYMAMIAVEMIIPLYIQSLRGYSALDSGLFLLPGSIAFAIMAPITGRLFDRYGARNLAATGFTILTLSTIPFIFLNMSLSMHYVTMFYAIRMFGIVMIMMPLTTHAMNFLPRELMSHGTAVNNTTRQVMGSIGTALITSVLTNVASNAKPAHSLLTKAPLAYKDAMENAVLNGYTTAITVAVGIALLGWVLSYTLKKGSDAEILATMKNQRKEGAN